MNLRRLITLPAFFIFCTATASAADLALPHSFTAGQKAQSSQVNENFQLLLDEINRLRAQLKTIQMLQPDNAILVDATNQVIGEVGADFYSVVPEIFDCQFDSDLPNNVDPEGNCLTPRNANRFIISLSLNGESYRTTVCNGTVDNGAFACDAERPYMASSIVFTSDDCTGIPYSEDYDLLNSVSGGIYQNPSSATPTYFPLQAVCSRTACPQFYSDSPSLINFNGAPLRVYETFTVVQNSQVFLTIDANQNAYVTDAPAIVTPLSRLSRHGVCEPIDSATATYPPDFLSQELRTFSLKPAGITLPTITLPVTAVDP